MLTVDDVRNAKAAPGETRDLSDKDGLFLKVRTTSKTWYLRIQRNGKRTTVKLGKYPELSLMEARRTAKALRAQQEVVAPEVAQAIAATALHRNETERDDAERAVERGMTFRECAEEWYTLKTNARSYSLKHLQTIRYRLEHYIYPKIGKLEVTKIRRVTLSDVVRSIAEKDHYETAKRVAGIIRQVFDHAMNYGHVEISPAQSLNSILPRGVQKQNFAHTVKPAEVGALISALKHIWSPRTKAALLLIAYCGTRVGETLLSVWSEFDLESGLWTIPAEHTKTKQLHTVPLAPQVVELLRWYKSTLVGGSCRNDARVFTQSEFAMLNKLKDITAASHGAVPKVTIHGFRHTASTILHGLGYNSMWVEAQLGHKDENKIRGTYNHFDFLDERRGMMCAYANWLDEQAAAFESSTTRPAVQWLKPSTNSTTAPCATVQEAVVTVAPPKTPARRRKSPATPTATASRRPARRTTHATVTA